MFGENAWLLKPIVVGGIVVAYEHFYNARGAPMMNHVKTGALASASSLASGYLANMVPLPEVVEAVSSPLFTGLTFAVGRKFVLGSQNGFLMDGVEAAGADFVSGFGVSMIKSFW